jgi:hypothetical protein
MLTSFQTKLQLIVERWWTSSSKRISGVGHIEFTECEISNDSDRSVVEMYKIRFCPAVMVDDVDPARRLPVFSSMKGNFCQAILVIPHYTEVEIA